MYRSSGSSRGVTLIELLAVMVLLAAMTALVAPAFSRSLDTFTLRSSGRRLAAEFRRAQLESRLLHVRVWAVYKDNQFIFYKNDAVTRVFEMPAGLKVEQAEKPLVYSFLSSGQIVGPSTIALSNARGRKGVLRLGGMLGAVEYQDGQQ